MAFSTVSWSVKADYKDYLKHRTEQDTHFQKLSPYVFYISPTPPAILVQEVQYAVENEGDAL
jgi:hypothetical protein